MTPSHAVLEQHAIDPNHLGNGMHIQVPPHARPAPAFHTLAACHAPGDRNLIVCENGSHSTIILEEENQPLSQRQNSGSSPSAIKERNLEINLMEGAVLTLIEIRHLGRAAEQKIATTAVISTDARLDHLIVTTKGGITDETGAFHLTGKNAGFTQRRATLAAAGERHTAALAIYHHAPGGTSEIAARSAVARGASCVTRTTVHIAPDAQKTRSRVDDHNLLTESGGMAESMPSMEILADDVQASHSASTTRLNDEHLFYLGSRGIESGDAKRIITLGFLEAILPDSSLPVDIPGIISQRFDEIHHGTIKRGINRSDFPILSQHINGKPLAYLDNAATAQKPQQVIEAIKRFYEQDNANIHRGVHTLSERATRLHEQARRTIASFINAKPSELVLVRNATEGINLAARSLCQEVITSGSRILLTEMEHHSNILPWQLIAAERGAVIDYVPVRPDGTLDLTSLADKLALKPAIIALTHVSNVLGTINPIKEISAMAHEQGALVLVDGAQSAPHIPIDVKELGCDFFAFSGHKLMGPTGIGALYMKENLLRRLPPFMSGGGMIKEVSFSKAIFKDGPEKYEAGTPDIAGAVGLAAAVEYLQGIGMDRIKAHNDQLVKYAWARLTRIPRITLYGPADPAARAGVIAFNLGDIHPHDVSTILDEEGVAIRAGHHCAMPLLEKMNVPSTCRVSVQFYNSTDDIDQFISAIQKAITVFFP